MKETWKKEFLKRARLETALGATAVQSLRKHADLEHARVAAEDRAATKALWGSDAGMSDEDMGDLYLGDITQNVQSPPTSKFAELAGKALLAAAIGAPAAWAVTEFVKMAADNPPAAAQPFTDTDTDTRIGLRILRDRD